MTGVQTCALPILEEHNLVSTPYIKFTPKPNMLLIFPAWLEHKVELNLKNDSRISAGFNSVPLPSLEKKL